MILRVFAALFDAVVGMIGWPFRIQGQASILLAQRRMRGSYARYKQQQAAKSHIWKHPKKGE